MSKHKPRRFKMNGVSWVLANDCIMIIGLSMIISQMGLLRIQT